VIVLFPFSSVFNLNAAKTHLFKQINLLSQFLGSHYGLLPKPSAYIIGTIIIHASKKGKGAGTGKTISP